MNMGQRIKSARLARKMTQQQLAEAVGVARPSVTQWEKGETKTLKGQNLHKVAMVLRVTTQWILYGDSEAAMSPRKGGQGARESDYMDLVQEIHSSLSEVTDLLNLLFEKIGCGADVALKTQSTITGADKSRLDRLNNERKERKNHANQNDSKRQQS